MMPLSTSDTPSAPRRHSSASSAPAPASKSPPAASESKSAKASAPDAPLLLASESSDAGIQELLAQRQGFADAGKDGDAAAVTSRLAELGYR